VKKAIVNSFAITEAIAVISPMFMYDGCKGFAENGLQRFAMVAKQQDCLQPYVEAAEGTYQLKVKFSAVWSPHRFPGGRGEGRLQPWRVFRDMHRKGGGVTADSGV
jgi:hypothetical protein